MPGMAFLIQTHYRKVDCIWASIRKLSNCQASMSALALIAALKLE